MVNSRPTLPRGHALRGIRPIAHVLHTDEECEIYLLEEEEESSKELLVLVRGQADVARKWWAELKTPVLQVAHELGASVPVGFSAGVVLEANGRSLEQIPFLHADSRELSELFGSLVDCVARSSGDAILPNLKPALCWQHQNGQVGAVLPIHEVPHTTEATVEYVARAFFRLASGVNPQGLLPPLSQWCRKADDRLSKLVSACTPNAQAKQPIRDLTQLNRELARKGIDQPDGFTGSPRQQVVADSAANGLNRVAGMKQLKELLRREVVEPVRNPEPYRQYGLSIPNGILLYGPPGCGKTYIARALADELGHHFFEIVPSEIASPFVHGSVIRIREVFDEAVGQAPSVIFIDEFEALAPIRSALGGFQQHKAEEVNEILTHLSGAADKHVFIVAATNQPEMIDPAVRRTGRLDKVIYVGPPDLEAREEMLQLHLKDRPVDAELDVISLAQQLHGYSASDIRFLVDEAAREALFEQEAIGETSFIRAMQRIRPSIPPGVEEQYRTILQRGL